jgi:Tfp pilus assembly protein PilO
MMLRLRQLLALAREHLFATVCLLLTLLGLSLSLVLQQQNTEAEIVQNRLRLEGDSANRILSTAGTLRADSATIDSALKEIDASLVDEDNLAENLGYFYIIEDQTQARIGDLRQGTAQPPEGERKYKTVPISLSITGTYAQIFNFLHKIETGSRQIRISSFTLNRRQPTGDTVNLTMDLEMLAYP